MKLRTISATRTRLQEFPHFTYRHCCRFGTAALIFSSSIGTAADLLKWDVTGLSGAIGSAVATAASAGVSGSLLTGGGATGNTTSPANTWNRTFALTVDAAAAQTAGNFFSFTTTAAAGFTVSISGITGLNLSKTSTAGPTSAALFFSTDGGTTFTQTGSTFTVTNILTSAATTFDDTIAVTPIVIAGGNTVHWRLVGHSGVAGRLGIGSAGTDDFTLTGTSVSDTVTHNLLWTGTGGNAWNTTPANTNWANTGNSNAPKSFITNDNVTINIPATITVDAGGVASGNVTVSNPTGTVALTGGSISGVVLTKSAAGTLTLDGTNTFSGGVSLIGGSAHAASNTALGTSTIGINGATLQTNIGATAIANVLTLGTAGSTLNTDGNVTFSGQLNTTGAAINTANLLTKSGAGILTLTRTGSSALGNQMSNDTTGGAVELDITAGGVVFSGTGTRNLGGTSTWDGPVTLHGGTLLLHGGAVNGTGSISVTANSSVNSRLNFSTANLSNPIAVAPAITLSLDSANGNNALAVSGIISGDGAITKTGNGVVRIEGTNTYTGVTTISAGTLRIGTGILGTLGTGEVVISAGTLQLNRDDNVTIPNLISGAGNVTASSLDHTPMLTAANTYTGITTITGGKLGAPVLTAGGIPSSIGQSTADAANLVFNGGSLSYAGASAASTDRDFTVGINGGGPSAIDAGSITYTSTNPITLAGLVPDTTASVSTTPTITALIPGTRCKIVTLGDTDFTLIGAASNTVGIEFTATGPGLGTGTVVSGLTVGTTYRIVAPGTTDFTLLGSANNLANTVFVATGSGFNSGTGTIAYANSNFRNYRLGGSGTGNNSIAASIPDGPTDPNTFNPNKTSFSKNGTSIWSTSGVNTYTGPTAVNEGILRIDGMSPASSGPITVGTGGSLGGNGLTGGAVTLGTGGGLDAKISNWTGTAGTGYNDLSVASLNAASVPMTVVIDTAGLANFTESVKSFTILNTTGGITNFSAANVTITALGFAGTGTWSLAQSGNSLVLSYALAAANPYLAWATGAPYNLVGANALPNADPDKDGINNSVEFVIGGNPASVSDSAKLPTIVVNNTNLIFTYRRSNASAYLNPTVQYSSNLTGWTTAQHGANGITIGAPTVVDAAISQIVVTIPKALAIGSKLFTRLDVVVP